MSVRETIANGGVIPQGQGEDPNKAPNKDTSPNGELSPEEQQLQEANQKKANILKAIEQAQQEYEDLKSNLRGTRTKIKDIKKNPNSGEDSDESDDGDDQTDPKVQAAIARELEKLKTGPRQQAIAQFLQDNPELAEDEGTRKEILRRYELLKTSDEMSPEGIYRDLESAHFSLRGREIMSKRSADDTQSHLYNNAVRFGGQPTQAKASPFVVTREVQEAAEQMSRLNRKSVGENIDSMRKRHEVNG